ncbi:hypothetical protein TCAL_10822 [Tigriopus californicus]|uniref:MARVEL domain-containing protein n=1 Tax=Tigriopus californicus TaxID=6832 RepID=A0A553NCJ3_TIGCA|nr:hypothetical protein TCAL_10822 [Tigriopus californicus]
MEQIPWNLLILATACFVINGIVDAQRPTEYVPLNSLTLKKLFRSNASSNAKDNSKVQSDPSWWSTVENSRKNRNRYTFQPKTSTRLLNQFLDLYSPDLTQIEDASVREELLYMLNYFVINDYEVDKGHVFEETFIRMSGKEPERRKEIIPPQRQSIISSFVDETLRQRTVIDTSTFYPQLSKFTTKDESSESSETINNGNQNSKIFSIKAYFTTPATLRPTIGTTSKLDLSLPSNKTHQVERTTVKTVTISTSSSTTTTTEQTTSTTFSTESDIIPTKSISAQETSTFARSSQPTFPTLKMLTSKPEQSKITLQELLQNPNPKPSSLSPEPTSSHIGLSSDKYLLTRPGGTDFVSPFLYQKASSEHKLQYFRPINKVPSPSSPQRENITTAYLAVSPFVTTEQVPRKAPLNFSFIESPFFFHSDEYHEEPPYHSEPLESPFAVDLGPTYKHPHHEKHKLHYPSKNDDYHDRYVHADFNHHRAGSNVPDLSLAEKNFIKHRQATPFTGGLKSPVKHPYQDSGPVHQDQRHSSLPQDGVEATTTESNDRNRLNSLHTFSYKMPKFDFDTDIRNLNPVLSGRNKASRPTIVNSYVQLQRPTSRTTSTPTSPTEPPTRRTRRPTRNRASDRMPSSSISNRPAIRNRIMTTTPITPFSEPKRPRLQSSLKPPSAIASLFNTGVEIRTADAQAEPLLQTISSSGPIDLPPSLLLHADLNKYAVPETSGGNRQPNRGGSTTSNQQSMQAPRQVNRQTTSKRTQNRWRDILTKEDSSEKVKLKELKELRNQNLLLLQILQNAFGEEDRNSSPPSSSSSRGSSDNRRQSSSLFSNPVLDLAALICILVQFRPDRASQYFMFVTISSFLVNGLIMFLTLCHVTQICPRTPLIEMGADALWILFYLIGASLLLSRSSSLLWNTKHLKAAGVIGFISIIVRIGCIGLNMLSWKRKRKPVSIGDHPSAPQDVRIRY